MTDRNADECYEVCEADDRVLELLRGRLAKANLIAGAILRRSQNIVDRVHGEERDECCHDFCGGDYSGAIGHIDIEIDSLMHKLHDLDTEIEAMERL
jgi:hypothetical protein